jgi:outer membrane protein
MVVVMTALFLSVTAGAFAMNVGYVDIEKVFNQYSGTKKAKEKLQGELEKEQKKIEEKKAEILKLKDDLEKKASVLEKSKVDAKKMELQTKLEKLQSDAMEIQQKLLGQEKEMTANIIEEIRVIVKKIAEEKKYEMVFEKNLLLYGGDDITPFVVKRMNEQ